MKAINRPGVLVLWILPPVLLLFLMLPRGRWCTAAFTEPVVSFPATVAISSLAGAAFAHFVGPRFAQHPVLRSRASYVAILTGPPFAYLLCANGIHHFPALTPLWLLSTLGWATLAWAATMPLWGTALFWRPRSNATPLTTVGFASACMLPYAMVLLLLYAQSHVYTLVPPRPVCGYAQVEF